MFGKIPGTDSRLIALMTREVIESDWVTDTSRYAEKRGDDPELFRLHTLPRAKEQYQHAVSIIQDASKRISKRLIAFERLGVQELAKVGIQVKVGKLAPMFPGATYSFTQPVMVQDSQGGRVGFNLFWEFRDDVSVSGRNWTTLFASGSPGLTFAHIILAIAYREHARTPAQFEVLMEGWRKRNVG